MAASGYEVVVIDSEGYTAEVLQERIHERGHRAHLCEATTDRLRSVLSRERIDALVMDFHLERPHELELCEIAKALDATIPVIAIAAPGVAIRDLEAWNAARRCIDQVVRKPLVGETFFKTLEALSARRRADYRAGRYAGLLAEDSVRWADAGHAAPSLAEMAVLFTDIRRSTQLVSSRPLPEWFEAINRALTDQADIIQAHGGSVVKFTGDGVMASFRGRGRAHHALRCAVALQEHDCRARYRDFLRIGIGLAEGVVMTGPIGAPGRQQYDVIGATVHLAARLCSVAREGGIVATPRLVRSAGFTGGMPPATQHVNLRGFDAPVECVSFESLTDRTTP